MPGDIITIQIGQAGCQVGNMCWQMFCLEHGIQPDGTMKREEGWDEAEDFGDKKPTVGTGGGSILTDKDPRSKGSDSSPMGKGNIPNNRPKLANPDAFKCMFSEVGAGKYKPRTLFIDLEPTVLNEMQEGAYRDFFKDSFVPRMYTPGMYICKSQRAKNSAACYQSEAPLATFPQRGPCNTGVKNSAVDDAANNFGRGHYTVGKEWIVDILDEIRKLAGNCSDLQGFNILHSIGGGTGSGLTSLLCQRLSVDYPGKSKVGFTIFPAPEVSTSVVEPYNAVLACHTLLEHMDLNVTFDNEAIFKMCQNTVPSERPSYNSMNRVISQCVASITASMRMGGSLNTTLVDLQSNLVPYPRMHFMMASYVSSAHTDQPKLTVNQLTEAAFKPPAMTISINPTAKHSSYIACTLMYRGDVSSTSQDDPVGHMDGLKTVKFANWCPKERSERYKWGITYKPPPVLLANEEAAMSEKSVCMLANSTTISQVFKRMQVKFSKMFDRRAYVHWFIGEGMEEGEFSEANEDLLALEKDYVALAGEA